MTKELSAVEALIPKKDRVDTNTELQGRLTKLRANLEPIFASELGKSPEVVQIKDRLDSAKATLDALQAKDAPLIDVLATARNLDNLLSSYKENEVAADARYKGKRIRVSGTVGDGESGSKEAASTASVSGGPPSLPAWITYPEVLPAGH